MLPDQVLNPGSMTYESGALLIALCGQACLERQSYMGQKIAKLIKQHYVESGFKRCNPCHFWFNMETDSLKQVRYR